jgi:transposase
MSKKRRSYSREFKQETVRLAESSEKSILQIERDLDIPHGLLNKWKGQLNQDGQQARLDQSRLIKSDEELRQLRKENELLRQERDILKKALAIFTQRQP